MIRLRPNRRLLMALACAFTLVSHAAPLWAQRRPAAQSSAPERGASTQRSRPSVRATAMDESIADQDATQEQWDGLVEASDEWDGPQSNEMCPDCGGWHGLGKRCGRHGEHGFTLFRSSANSPRYIGDGIPLTGTSWRNRPFSFGIFAGVLNGDDLIGNRVHQDSDAMGGARFGWDADYYWGIESRVAWSALGLRDNQFPPVARHNQTFLWDLSLLYYPWGDSMMRPYLLAGMGIATADFYDHFNVLHQNTLLGIPIGGGIKFQMHRAFVVRVEALDNIAVGSSGLDTMHNLSFTMGLEFRLGGPRRSYYPWHASRHMW